MKTELQRIYTEKLPESPSFEMILVEGGTFQMGGDDKEARDNEKPIHQVQVRSFYMGKFPVTQSLYESIMGTNPSEFKGPNNPVERVSWEDTQEFISQLNQKTGKNHRLPSEAEWEFAARGGIYSEGYLYAGSDRLKDVGWYKGNNEPRGTKPVGRLLENELGIHDLSGNVYEWCEDDFHNSYQGAPTDGSAWMDQPKWGRSRVLRGGGWDVNARYCRVSSRARNSPGYRVNGVGFRLVFP
ncbi:MAG: formylglycine-generating enzyme family protein [Bacteroidota bacterium]